MNVTISATFGSAGLLTSVASLSERFVHLVFVQKLVLTGHRPKTQVTVQWYFSGNDIKEHQLEKNDGIRVYVSTAPRGPLSHDWIRNTSSYGKFERSLSEDV